MDTALLDSHGISYWITSAGKGGLSTNEGETVINAQGRTLPGSAIWEECDFEDVAKVLTVRCFEVALSTAVVAEDAQAGADLFDEAKKAKLATKAAFRAARQREMFAHFMNLASRYLQAMR